MSDREVAARAPEPGAVATAQATSERAPGHARGARSPGGARPLSQVRHGSGADDLGGLLARAVVERGRGGGVPAGSLAARLSTGGRRELQRYVYKEGSAKAPAVPASAKSHAKWCVGKQAWLDTNAAPMQIGLRTVQTYTKFKETWVGHMVYNNDPDPHKAKRAAESDADYESRRQTKLPIDGDYREYDVQAYVAGARGTDRVIVDRTSKRAWYTGDHYTNLVELTL